jgi:hypothetical protein
LYDRFAISRLTTAPLHTAPALLHESHDDKSKSHQKTPSKLNFSQKKAL